MTNVKDKPMSITSLPQKNQDGIATAKDVLLKEAEALKVVAENLGDDFTNAIHTLCDIKGRVVVTGMGKSGHIAAKVAATLASTGTPAFFVHPGEASHGDLGMITKEDAVIAIGHGGESKELGDILSYCARFDVPLVAVTGNVESTLAKAATFVLWDGVTEEACPLNMAPTSSSTCALAIGDAIAVTMMMRKGFSREDFSQYHPGGKLGAQMLKVSDIMVDGDNVPCVTEKASVDEAIIEMTSKNLGGVGILNGDGDLVGIISDGDLKRHMSPNLLGINVTEIMTKDPQTVKPDVFAASAVHLMQEKKITTLFVLENKKPIGVLRILDCLQAGVI
jgi:arabinose-5-phosphate isomerase